MSAIFIKNIREIGIDIDINKDIKSKLNLNNDKINYKNINETVINIYEINYKNSSLYFIETDNYFIIFDTLENLLSDELDLGDDIIIPPVIKTGSEFSECISLLYTKASNVIHIDYIKYISKCKFGDLDELKKGTEKIFSKLFGILKKLDFNGKIILDDMATTSDGSNIKLSDLRITYKDLSEISIYQSLGFKINPKNYSEAERINQRIKQIISNKFPDMKLKYPLSTTEKNSINAKEVYKILQEEIKKENVYKIFEDMELQFPQDVQYNILYQTAGKIVKSKNMKKKTKKQKTLNKKKKKTKKTKKNKKII